MASRPLRWCARSWVVAIAAVATLALAPDGKAACDHGAANRPRIGLVLGGGGARGSAHIGVIRVLEQMRVPVDYVAGTSIGSLVGALLATGMSADQLEQVMLGLNWNDLFRDETAREDQPFRRKRDDNLALFGPKLGIGKDASLVPKGAISGQKLSFLFEKMIRERTQTDDFDDLPIPFRAVAADVITGDQVVFTQGDLAVAMRASMSVPGIFDPVAYGDHMLVDGGIVDNLPVDVVRAMGADVIIAVNVGSALTTKENLSNALAIVGQLSNLMIKSNTDKQIASLTDHDVLITPDLGNQVSSADFDKAAQGIAIGYRAADALRGRLSAYSLSKPAYAAYRKAVASCVEPMPSVDFVRLDNRTRFDDSVILRRITIHPGQPLDLDQLDQDVRQIHALGFIELARYEVVHDGGRTGVVIHVTQDVRGTKMIEWGLDYVSDGDSSSLSVRGGYLNSAVDPFGSELRLVAQLGEDPGLLGDLYKYMNPNLKLFIEPQVFAQRANFTTYQRGHPTSEVRVDQYGASMSIGREIGRAASIAVGVRSFAGSVDTRVGINPAADLHYQGGEYFARAIFDRLDDRYFPSHGGLVDMRYQSASESLGADQEYDQFMVDAFLAKTFARHTLMAGGRYYETLNDVAPVYAQFRAGGFLRLSGYQDQEIAGQNFAMVMAGYRYHVAGSGLIPAHLGMTLEYGQVAEDRDELFHDAVLNGSVYFGYNSPIGPLYLGVGLGEGGLHRYFLRIGNVFGNTTIGR